jgi:magnesium transporter
VIYLTEMLGLRAVDSEGQPLGRIREVALTPAQDSSRVSLFLVGKGRRRLEIPWDQVAVLSPQRKTGLRIKQPASTLREFDASESGETAHLLISRDLLDQQIIDVDGRKVVRVNDVHFNEQLAGGAQEFRVAEVEVGLTGAVRRIFQGVLPPGAIRAIEPWLSRTIIPWDFVDLIETDPLRRVKLKITHDKLARLHPADLADIVEELAPAEREAIFESIDEGQAAEALSELEPKMQRSIIESLETERAADIVEEMETDEAADLLAEIDQETSEEILDDMEVSEARELEELLEYGEHTAGGMMNKDFIALAETGTVDSAIELLRTERETAENANTVFVLDDQQRLTAAIPLVQLFLASPATELTTIKPLRLIFAHLDSSEEDVVELFDKYNLLSLPVVDESYHLAGVITADDIISVLRDRK